MISINVMCTGKNSRLEGKNVVTDITFQPVTGDGTPTHATGAVIGVPDPSNAGAENLQEAQQPRYNLTSGGLSINVTNTKEADAYQIGESYSLAINTSAVAPQTESKSK